MGPSSSDKEEEAVCQVTGHMLGKAGDPTDCCLHDFHLCPVTSVPLHTLSKGKIITS